MIEIPLPAGGQTKPAWVVDGRKRLLALSRCRRKDFPIPVVAFVADEVAVQREQFLRVAETQPLPAGILDELLPEASTSLPGRLPARKLPGEICAWLNRSPASPFFDLIGGGTPGRNSDTHPPVANSFVVRMVAESLSSPGGCLFPYRNLATRETDVEGVCAVLVAYWSAVKRVFPEAWGKSPEKSRLMHGAGILAMGRVMDHVMAGISGRDPRATQHAEQRLRLVAPLCRWTGGVWEELGGLRWDRVVNSPRHLSMLSNYLIRSYLHAERESRF
jgi:DGQHR domain-containing protein